MERKLEKVTVKIRREPPVFEFEGEVTLVRLALKSGENDRLSSKSWAD